MMLPYVAARSLASEVAGGAMVLGGLMLAFVQDASGTLPPDASSSLITALIQALTVGGGLAVFGAFALKRIDKILDARDASAKEEREEERKDRERMVATYEALLQRYIDREVRIEERNQAHIDGWRTMCESERSRNETLVAQVIERVSCTVHLPPTP